MRPEEVVHLFMECGHHCGIITTGKVRHVAHCSCSECPHNPIQKEQ